MNISECSKIASFWIVDLEKAFDLHRYYMTKDRLPLEIIRLMENLYVRNKVKIDNQRRNNSTNRNEQSNKKLKLIKPCIIERSNCNFNKVLLSS